MEKSIENIWKEGFKKETTFIPEIKNMNDLKSIYFVDQFKQRYRVNIILLLLTAILVLFAFILGGIPFLGLYMFALFATLGLLGNGEISKLNKLNNGASNYIYIQAFDAWLKQLLHKFSLIYKIWLPLLFIGFALALLQTNFFIPFIGETLVERLTPTTLVFQIFGFPLWSLVGILFLAGMLSYLSDYLFQREMQSIYGDLISKLDRLLADLNTLQ